MIQFTGLLETNGAYYKDGFLVLTPHLGPFGITTLDVLIQDMNQKQLTTLGYNSIPKETFDISEPTEGNHYDKIISALQVYVINDLQEKNPEVQFEVVPIPQPEQE